MWLVSAIIHAFSNALPVPSTQLGARENPPQKVDAVETRAYVQCVLKIHDVLLLVQSRIFFFWMPGVVEVQEREVLMKMLGICIHVLEAAAHARATGSTGSRKGGDLAGLFQKTLKCREHTRADSHFWGGCPGGSVVKKLPAMQETQVQSLGREDPWTMKGQPTPVFLPGKSHGQRGLAGCGPWGHKESDTTQ